MDCPEDVATYIHGVGRYTSPTSPTLVWSIPFVLIQEAVSENLKSAKIPVNEGHEGSEIEEKR